MNHQTITSCVPAPGPGERLAPAHLDVELCLYINAIVLEALSNKLPPGIRNHLDGPRAANRQMCCALLQNAQGPDPSTLEFVKDLFAQQYGIDLNLTGLPTVPHLPTEG